MFSTNIAYFIVTVFLQVLFSQALLPDFELSSSGKFRLKQDKTR